MPTDPEIVDEIVRRIQSDPRLDHVGLRLHVDSQDGVVVLSGTVARLADKRRVENLVRQVDGVEDANNLLTVAPDVEVDDAQLEISVARALMQDRALEGNQVQMTVCDGVVTLRGSVLSLALKRYAGVLAWWVPGVRDVVNQLDLRWPEEDNDSEITEAVKAALDKDYLVDSTAISVHTHAGTVTLRGAVFGEEQRDAAENDAWFVLGVREVNNELQVSPETPPKRP
ncbi:MAG: BON domain-containing protein [Chloroflexota bacterium]